MPNVMEPIDTCQKCGGPVWDNRVDKKNPKGPDFKCKDKECGEGFWLGEAKGGKVQPKQSSKPTFTVAGIAGSMNEVYDALQLAGFGTDLITADVCFKVVFTVLKGRNPGD